MGSEKLNINYLNKKQKIYFYIKRMLDIILALFGLVVALLPMLIISILVKLEDGGPILFRQERTGLNGKKFVLYKFRTMAIDNDVHDFSKGDKHTRIGTFLRKTSLDELGQLINILKGDMSFIGPRPWIPDYYERMNDKQKHRCDVLPGITGLAQAKGRNNISIFDKINYDIEYVNNYSLIEDIKIIFLTIKTVLSKEGADAGKNAIQKELDDLNTQKIPVNEINKSNEEQEFLERVSKETRSA